MIPRILNKNGLFLLKPVNTALDLEYLHTLPAQKQYLKIYKKFYRLRNLVGHNRHHRNRYLELIRWRFTRDNFNVKRSILIGLPTLSAADILDRVLNTLAFVNNSTVALPENLQESSTVYIQGIGKPQRIETDIVTTILTMQYQKPNSIKYDIHYQWIKNLKHNNDNVNDKTPREKSSFDLQGFYNYEMNLMILNETYHMCL